jgi:hypothetical protein
MSQAQLQALHDELQRIAKIVRDLQDQLELEMAKEGR